jgi:hypothetical protein
MSQLITPAAITKLKKNEVFVFGSNLNGNHAGGAAKLALDKFGAEMGCNEGHKGQSYAIPTLNKAMNKVDLSNLKIWVDSFIDYATENPKLKFLVTEIGCGIAGFNSGEIAPLFKSGLSAKNIALPQAFVDVLIAPVIVPGYKGFDLGMKCRGFQFGINQTFEEKVAPSTCNRGFHFCELPLNVFGYYPPKIGTEYAEIEAVGVTDKREDKTCTNKLAIKGKISIGNLFKAHFDIVYDKVKKEVAASEETVTTAGQEAHANTAGNYAHANTAGNYAHANTAGQEAHANTAGQEAHANTAGNYAHANTAGNYAHANTAGYKAHANTAGNYAHANTAGQEAHANTAGQEAHASVKGKNSIAVALGVGSHAKGAKGCWIVITEWEEQPDWSYDVKEVKSVLVDGETIKADTFYKLESGKIVEA